MHRWVNVKTQLRHNSLCPNLITKEKLSLQSRLLDKIIRELQQIAVDGGYHATPFWWLLYTPDDFSHSFFSIPSDVWSCSLPMWRSHS